MRQTIKKSEDNFKIAVIRETKQLLIILSYLLSSVILVLPITMNALPCKTSNTVFFFFKGNFPGQSSQKVPTGHSDLDKTKGSIQ